MRHARLPDFLVAAEMEAEGPGRSGQEEADGFALLDPAVRAAEPGLRPIHAMRLGALDGVGLLRAREASFAFTESRYARVTSCEGPTARTFPARAIPRRRRAG